MMLSRGNSRKRRGNFHKLNLRSWGLKCGKLAIYTYQIYVSIRRTFSGNSFLIRSSLTGQILSSTCVTQYVPSSLLMQTLLKSGETRYSAAYMSSRSRAGGASEEELQKVAHAPKPFPARRVTRRREIAGRLPGKSGTSGFSAHRGDSPAGIAEPEPEPGGELLLRLIEIPCREAGIAALLSLHEALYPDVDHVRRRAFRIPH